MGGNFIYIVYSYIIQLNVEKMVLLKRQYIYIY